LRRRRNLDLSRTQNPPPSPPSSLKPNPQRSQRIPKSQQMKTREVQSHSHLMDLIPTPIPKVLKNSRIGRKMGRTPEN